jgi:hypothetical protein
LAHGVHELKHDDEFATRFGSTRGEAQVLLADVRAALRD